MHRAVGIVRFIINEYRLFAVKIQFQFFRQARMLHHTLSLQRVIEKQKAEQHNRQRKSVAHNIRTFDIPYHLRRHIPCFSGNTEALSVGRNIVVVADKRLAGRRIEKEVSVIQILIGKAFSVQFPEAVGNIQCRIGSRRQRGKMHLCQQKIRKLPVI